MPSRRTLLATCGCLLLAGCSTLESDANVTGSWPQQGYDATATGAPSGFEGPEPPLATEWTYEYPRGDGYGTSPVVTDGSVYVAAVEHLSDGRRSIAVHAVDPTTGEREWKATVAELPADVGRVGRDPYTHRYSDSLTTGDGRLCFQTVDGLVTLTTDGNLEWTFDNVGDGAVYRTTSQPTIADDTVYVGRGTDDGLEGDCYALDLESGDVRWRRDFEEWPTTARATPAVADGVVYVADGGRGVVALDADDGTERWRVSLPVDSEPTVADGRLYVTTSEGSHGDVGIVALDAETGRRLWERADAVGEFHRQVAAADGVVYYSSQYRLQARDAETGEQVWTDDQLTGSAEREKVYTGRPAVVGDRVYATGLNYEAEGNRSRTFVFDREDGRVVDRWKPQSGGGLRFGSVAVVDGWLYANADGAGVLYGIGSCETEIVGRCLR